MQLTIKGAAGVAPGTYQARLRGIEEKESREGAPYLRWTFAADGPEGARDVTGASSTNTGPKAKAYRWLQALLGRAPVADESLDIEGLIGRFCTVVIEENDDGFTNVVDVLPKVRLSDATVAAYAAEADATNVDDLPF